MQLANNFNKIKKYTKDDSHDFLKISYPPV